MKKGLLATVIVGLVLAISLSVYTIAEVAGGSRYVPSNYTLSVSYRTGDEATILKGYSVENGSLELIYGEEIDETNTPLEYDADNDVYMVVNAGEFVAKTHAANGDMTTYNVTTYTQGTGDSAASPYIICNADHLVEYAEAVNDDAALLGAYIEMKGDIDLADINWHPIGNRVTPFTGTIIGNGYTVENMSIVVNEDNYKEYLTVYGSSALGMEVGFFGKTVGATIYDLNFAKANIQIKEAVCALLINKAYSDDANFGDIGVLRVAVGTVAGYMTRTVYSSTTENNVTVGSVIRGFSLNNAAGSNVTPNGIGTIAGVASESVISKLDIASTIYADYEYSAESKIEGSTVGGVVGFIHAFDTTAGLGDTTTAQNKTTIDNVNVTATVYTKYYLGEGVETLTGSARDKRNYVGLIAAVANNANISNVTVSNSKILDNRGTYQLVPAGELPGQEYLALISGGVADAYSNGNDRFTGDVADFYTVLNNVTINGLSANPAAMFGGVVGVARKNTVIIDSSANRVSATTAHTGGFAFEIEEGATVTFTEDFNKEYAVNATLKGVQAAGFAVTMKGTVIGFVNDNDEKTTIIKSVITGYSSEIGGLENIDAAADLVVASGFAAYMYSTDSTYTATVKDVVIDTNINKSINIVGVASMLNGTVRVGDVPEGSALVDGVEIVMVAESYTNVAGGYSTTKIVAGAVGQIFDKATIQNVKVTITLNDGVSGNYGAAIFGGLVAHVLGDNNVVVSNNEVSGSALITEGNFWTRKVADAPDADSQYIEIVGGLIGLIADSDYNSTSVKGLTITSNNVDGLAINIIGEFKYTAETTNTGIFFRVRGVGSLVGNINNKMFDGENPLTDEILDLSSNTVANTIISVSFDAFTFVNNSILVGGEAVEQVLVGRNSGYNVGTVNEYIDNVGFEYITASEAEEGTYVNLDLVA